MQRLDRLKGKTIREWADADLPYGAFERMVREVDPFFGIYADAGAQKARPTNIQFISPRCRR